MSTFAIMSLIFKQYMKFNNGVVIFGSFELYFNYKSENSWNENIFSHLVNSQLSLLIRNTYGIHKLHL